jgi:hypothetical protein
VGIITTVNGTINTLKFSRTTYGLWLRDIFQSRTVSRCHFTPFFLLISLILTFFFTTRLLYPSWYKERWTVLLDTRVSLFSLNFVVTSFNGVLLSLRTSLASTLVSLSSSKRRRPVWSLFFTDPLRLKRTTTSETVPLRIFKAKRIQQASCKEESQDQRG